MGYVLLPGASRQGRSGRQLRFRIRTASRCFRPLPYPAGSPVAPYQELPECVSDCAFGTAKQGRLMAQSCLCPCLPVLPVTPAATFRVMPAAAGLSDRIPFPPSQPCLPQTPTPSPSAWSPTPTWARPRSPAPCFPRTWAKCAMSRTSPTPPTATSWPKPRRATCCCCGTPRASATVPGWPNACCSPTNPSAGSSARSGTALPTAPSGPASRPCTTSAKRPTWCSIWSTPPKIPRTPATSNPK